MKPNLDPTPLKAPWAKEARDLGPDPVTGAFITRLSGSSIRTHNIYCTAPIATADGNRVAGMRDIDNLITPVKALLSFDLTTKHTTLIEREFTGWPIGPAWRGAAYYMKDNRLIRASLETYRTEPVLDLATVPRVWQLMAVSQDERFLLYTAVVADSPEAYNLVRVDLHDGSWVYLLDETTTERIGCDYNPATSDEILISKTFWVGPVRKGGGFLADALGKKEKPIFTNAHHATWLGNGRGLAVLHEFDGNKIAHLPAYPEGELFIYSKDSSPSRLLAAREHLYYHINSSRDGRYVVCESLESGFRGPMPIVVINIETGKHRTLVSDCGCTPAGDDCRQAKPFFTADSRHVIYTADPDGIVNVYAVQIPAGFLEGLGA